MPRSKTGSPNNSTFPEWIQPMAATLTQERFAGAEWSFERKFDGIRLIAYKKGNQVELFSRNRLPQHLPSIAAAIARLPQRELILDGEIDWHALSGPHAAEGMHTGNGTRGRVRTQGRMRIGGRTGYHIFDIMWIDGREVMSLPLEERRRLLRQLPFTPPLHRVTELKDANPFARAQQEGWEGVIAKRRGSVYEQRRSPHWLKLKCELAQEFVVGGFTDPQGKRVGLGALLIGYYEPKKAESSKQTAGDRRREAGAEAGADDFVFAGRIGTGFNTELLLDLRARLNKIEIAKPPFTKAVGLPRLRAHWVKPKIVVQVGFIQWTKYGKLRHPRLLGVRHDKDAREVVRE